MPDRPALCHVPAPLPDCAADSGGAAVAVGRIYAAGLRPGRTVVGNGAALLYLCIYRRDCQADPAGLRHAGSDCRRDDAPGVGCRTETLCLGQFAVLDADRRSYHVGRDSARVIDRLGAGRAFGHALSVAIGAGGADGGIIGHSCDEFCAAMQFSRSASISASC